MMATIPADSPPMALAGRTDPARAGRAALHPAPNPAVQLDGAVCLVTGAARGIGAALAAALADAGARVVSVDRNLADGPDAIRCDLADPVALAAVVPAVVSGCGRLDILINNAGLARHSPVTGIELGDLEVMWAVNVRATIALTRDAMRVMGFPSGRGGHIVNIISTAGLGAPAGESAYCATKFAVRGFTEAATEEGRLCGVRVHGLYPAGVVTDFWDEAVPARSEFIGQKEFLAPSDVAAAVIALLSLPAHVDTPSLVVRHAGDADLAGLREKLDLVAR